MTEKERTYTDDQVEARLESDLPGWELRDGWIRRKYKTPGWPHTLMAVNAVGYIAEAACHHPDLSVSYAELHVKLQTHSAGGITDKDFELAARIDEHLLWMPQPEDDTAFDGFETMMKKKWVR